MRNNITIKVVADFTVAASRLSTIFRKSKRLTSACVHALNAERRARRLRRRGEIRAAEVWERHAAICRRVGGRVDFGAAACTP
jgi:hypothetical protein